VEIDVVIEKGLVTKLAGETICVHLVEFSLYGNSHPGFFLGWGDSMSFVIPEHPELTHLAHNKARHFAKLLVLMLAT
jgi:hypothetical protein